jgi:UrcA family protein
MIATTCTLPSSPRTRIAIAMLTCGLLIAGTPVARAASSPADVPQVRVSYSDLILTNEHDALLLYRRIAAAAREVCPPESSVYARRIAGRHCVSEAISRAVRDVGSPKLAQVEAAHARRWRPS